MKKVHATYPEALTDRNYLTEKFDGKEQLITAHKVA